MTPAMLLPRANTQQQLARYVAVLQASRRRAQRGVSLVELMIAITLGLVAVGGAGTIFLANRQSFAQVEGLARVQENARFAVELLARDIREAGNAVCGGVLTSVNIVPTGNTWTTWTRGLVGDDWTAGFSAPTGNTAPIANTDSLLLWSASSGATPVRITAHTTGASGSFTVASAPGYSAKDVITACDGSQLATFQVSSVSGTTVSYTNGDNLTNAISAGGFLNPLSAKLWYVGLNTAGTANALRRLSRSSTAGDPKNDEMVEGVTNMQIQYLLGDSSGVPTATSYVDASSVSDWPLVIAVRVTLTLRTQDKVGVANGASTYITHTVPFTVAIRRRLQ
jgi:type IV pilus assembly protein PilW